MVSKAEMIVWMHPESLERLRKGTLLIQRGVNMIQADPRAGTFAMSCDHCDKMEIFYVCGDWHEMLARARDLRWKITKGNCGWRHSCPRCSGAEVSRRL